MTFTQVICTFSDDLCTFCVKIELMQMMHCLTYDIFV